MMRWYVLRSKYRNEDLLWKQLCNGNIEVYYPRLLPCRLNSKRKTTKLYFPGYLFINVDLTVVSQSSLLWSPGEIGLVCLEGEPAHVSDAVLHAIREHVGEINAEGGERFQNLKHGDQVAIQSGPFAGHHGIFDTYLSGYKRATILLKLIRDQQVRVDLPVRQIT
jgi:transcription antitermination factor NusG